MTQYTLLDPITGDSSTVNERDLTRNLQLNVILLREDEHVGIVTHQDIVLFCRWCAEKTLSRYQNVPTKAWDALKLVDKWLIDPDSVSNEEMDQAARAAWDVAWAAAKAIRAALHATQTARAAWDVAQTAAGAAARAVNVVGVSFQVQARWFLEHLRSTQ